MSFADEESKYMEVNYSFLLPHGEGKLKIFQKADQLYSALDEIYHMAQAKSKTCEGDNPDLADFARSIAWMASEELEV